jgi:predicted metal-dependent hydrolase
MKRLLDLTREAGQAMLQLTLPLFDSASAASTDRPQQTLKSPPRPPASRPLPPDPIANPGRSLHAVSRRVTRLGDHPVEYQLRRSRRRTIGFCVDDSGLRVTAPRWVSIAEIDAALIEKESWILRKLVEWRDHAQRRDRLAVKWEDGAALTLLGQRLVMRIDVTARGITLQADGELRIGLPPDADSEQLSNAVKAWMQNHARRVFSERLAIYCPRLGVEPTRWRLSSARTRWGSCAADGSIRLNWRLVHFPIDIVDYVIVHELAHLREMNHGPRFWATVQSLLPEFESARRQLKDFPDDLTMS